MPLFRTLWQKLVHRRPKTDATVASLLLRSPRLLDAGTLFAAHSEWWPQEERPSSIDFGEGGAIYGEGAATFQASAAKGFLCVGNFPIPDLILTSDDDHDWPPKTADLIRQHSAHVVVGLASNSLSPLERAVCLTRWVASVAEACDALAVNWGDAGAVMPREQFCQLAREMNGDFLPVLLWVRFGIEREADGSASLATAGMREFGHWEIEVNRARVDDSKLLGYAAGLSSLLLTEGPIPDGHTVGFSDDDRVRVRHTQGSDGSGPAYLLDFGSHTQ